MKHHSLRIFAAHFTRFTLFTLGTLLLACPAPLHAQAYPARSIRLIIPNPPGGANDALGRVFAPKFAEALGQPVVIENRPGSNGNIAGEMVARSPPDGYTLLLGIDSQIVVNPHLYSKMPFDTLKDLAPVATLASAAMLLAVSAALPVKNFQEFIEYARRANPPLPYASIGNGSQHHLAMEMLKARAGINLLHVPYKGGAPAALAMLTGDVGAMFGGTSLLVHAKTGKIRILAVTGKKRDPAYPDLPAVAEFYPGYESGAWIALFAAAGTPPTVIARLRAEVDRVLADADLRQKVKNVGGLEPWATTAEEFAEVIRLDYAKSGQIVKSIGATID